jgi:hypothetical protein
MQKSLLIFVSVGKRTILYLFQITPIPVTSKGENPYLQLLPPGEVPVATGREGGKNNINR